MKRLALMAVVALAACSKAPEPQQQVPQQVVQQQAAPQQVYQQPAPVQYVQQPAPVVVQQESGLGNLATGMLLGHMLSGGGGGGGSSSNVTRNTTVVNKTVVNKTYVQPAATPKPAARPATLARRK